MDDSGDRNKPYPRNEHLEALAARLYSDELPYHNFDHAMQAVGTGLDIVARCRAEGAIIDPELVYLALLFHDAGYHEDHHAMGFASKEDFSAYLAGETLHGAGFGDALIARVQEVIRGTCRDAVATDNEMKAVRAADLAGLAADYATFLENTEKLKEEHELLSGRRVSWPDWMAAVKDVVEFYLSEDIALSSGYRDRDGTSKFHRRARENLDRLLGERPVNPRHHLRGCAEE